jgi:hypothetical protein
MAVSVLCAALCPLRAARLVIDLSRVRPGRLPIRKVTRINIENHAFLLSLELDSSRVGNFRQNNYSALEDRIDGTIGWSGGILAFPRKRKLPEFCSEPFRRGEKCSEFCTSGTIIEANSWNSVLTHSAEEKQLVIPFREQK